MNFFVLVYDIMHHSIKLSGPNSVLGIAAVYLVFGDKENKKVVYYSELLYWTNIYSDHSDDCAI